MLSRILANAFNSLRIPPTNPMKDLTRRRFFEDSLMAAAAVALPAPLIAADKTSASPNEKLTAAIIGCGIRGKTHAHALAKLADCDVAYVCDSDLDRADEVGALLVKLKRPMPKKVQDLRAVLDDKSVDIGNNNVHSLDICRWGLGVTGLGRSVMSYGGRLGYTNVAETPNSQVGIFDFGDKTIVSETRGLKTAPFHPAIKSMWFFYGSEASFENHS